MKNNFDNFDEFQGFEIEKDLCEKHFEEFLNSIANMRAPEMNIDNYKEKLREAIL